MPHMHMQGGGMGVGGNETGGGMGMEGGCYPHPHTMPTPNGQPIMMIGPNGQQATPSYASPMYDVSYMMGMPGQDDMAGQQQQQQQQQPAIYYP